MARMGVLSAALLVLVFLVAGCGGNNPMPPSNLPSLALTLVTSGFSSPLGLEQSGDGSGRLFVVEQGGKIKIIQNGSVLSTPFLDISSKISMGSEMGLLGVTFHPNYSANGKLYVNYTRTVSGQIQSVIAEYTASPAGSNQVNIATERILLTVDQVGNFTNHKAGQLAFGPDGLLYFGLGDGGSGGDPFGHGQSTATLLGKMMRIDVNSTDAGLQYHVPADNPFAAGGGLPEIWAFGFRNPWRFSFDRATGRLFVADVGQDQFEEIDIVQKGGNYGWNVMEGMHCFNPPSGCNTTGLIPPIAEYSHAEGNAVIGGFVYRGANLPTLRGIYVFGDLGTGKIFVLQETTPNVFTRTLLMTTGKTISSFGQDQAGELYVVDIGAGNIFKLVAN
ncbi:MAG TPA: PQQ-dependent sugar dehydrogenase [Candidatus Angelobacter sp.]|nr:PQQ-dependent sugar dehydrogenase [Candidatus Angelobacter sp.]